MNRTVLLRGLWLAAFCLGGTSAAAQTALRDLSRSMEAAAAKIAPAVVLIRVIAYGPVEGSSTAISALIGTQRNTGSGVLLSADGYLVTNAHVVAGGRRFVVTLPRAAASGVPGKSAVPPVSQEVAASLVGADLETDLAVLKVDLTGLTFATLGDSDSLRPGQLVLAFGSPLGLASSVTMGIISAVGRQLREEDRMLYIQTDTPINPGSSGGPLVSADGAVVGISTLILTQSGGNEGIGFAAPSNIVRHVYEQIRANHRVRRGVIGVFAQTITPTLAAGLKLPRDWGVILGDVYPGSPASIAGLRVGDMIPTIDGKPIENGRQFDVTIYQRPIGSVVTLEVWRGLQHFTVKVPVVERSNEPTRFQDMVTPEENLIPRLGILALELTPELARVIPGLRQPSGVVVAGVAPDATSPGGLAPGDVIHAMNGSPLATVTELRTALAQVAPASPAVFLVGREGQLRFVTVVLE